MAAGMTVESIVLAIIGILSLLLGLRALVRGRITLGFKKHPELSKLLLKTPPVERRGTWARILGILLLLLAAVLLFAAAASFLEACGYTEWYTRSPASILIDDKVVRLMEIPDEAGPYR